VSKWKLLIMTEFRKKKVRAFCYNIRDMNRQMRSNALYGI